MKHSFYLHHWNNLATCYSPPTTHFFISQFAQFIFLLLGEIPKRHIKKVVEGWSRISYRVTLFSFIFIVTLFILFFIWYLVEELKCSFNRKYEIETLDYTVFKNIENAKREITFCWASFQAFTGSESYPL